MEKVPAGGGNSKRTRVSRKPKDMTVTTDSWWTFIGEQLLLMDEQRKCFVNVCIFF